MEKTLCEPIFFGFECTFLEMKGIDQVFGA
jgi:hypothetical protein